jgi:hypothetical protein
VMPSRTMSTRTPVVREMIPAVPEEAVETVAQDGTVACSTAAATSSCRRVARFFAPQMV